MDGHGGFKEKKAVDGFAFALLQPTAEEKQKLETGESVSGVTKVEQLEATRSSAAPGGGAGYWA